MFIKIQKLGSQNCKIETSKKIPLKTENAKIINFYTGNILEDSRTVDLGMFIKIQKLGSQNCKNRNF